MPSQHPGSVHFLEPGAAVVDDLPGDDLQAHGTCFGYRSSMAVDEADDDIGPSPAAALSLIEHGHGLAGSRGDTQVDAEVIPCPGGAGDVSSASCVHGAGTGWPGGGQRLGR